MYDFSVEEINLMCIYNTDTRTALISELETAMTGVYDPEMLEIFASTIEKLASITDEDFENIGLYVADEM